MVLIFDPAQCRNSGTVEASGVVWELDDVVPLAWRGTGRREGALVIVNDLDAIFVGDDGTELRLTTGGHTDECVLWDAPDIPADT